MRIIVQLFAALLLLTSFSACSLLDPFMIVSVETDHGDGAEVTDQPPAVTATWDNNVQTLDIGSYCWTGPDVGVCVDRIPPSYTADQFFTAQAGTAVTLQFAEPFPLDAAVSAYVGSDLTGEVLETVVLTLENGQAVWTVPQQSGEFVLMVTARWSGGDSFYTLPLTIQ